MLNVAVVMGRLVADPELRHTPSDIAVTSFTLAVDRQYKSGTEQQADFIDIVAWRGTAEFVCKYFTKGQMIAVHGSIQTRTYQDKDGNKRKTFEIVAGDVNFCGDKKASRESEEFKNVEARPQAQEHYNTDFEEINGNDDLPF